MQIEYSPEFRRVFRKLHRDVKLEAIKKEKIFRANPRDPRLKTHKLSGRLEGYLAFSITYSYRIIFTIESKKFVRFHSIGGHDMYK